MSEIHEKLREMNVRREREEREKLEEAYERYLKEYRRECGKVLEGLFREGLGGVKMNKRETEELKKVWLTRVNCNDGRVYLKSDTCTLDPGYWRHYPNPIKKEEVLEKSVEFKFSYDLEEEEKRKKEENFGVEGSNWKGEWRGKTCNIL